MISRTAASFLTSIIFGLLSTGVTLAEDFDLVILNGRVMDPETSLDDIANVGVKDGRIVTITKDEIAGAETIDASGHVVAPGFIDTHFHWTRPIGYKLALRDGVTTAMDLEAGVYPSLPFAEIRHPRHLWLHGVPGVVIRVRPRTKHVHED